MMRSGDVGSAAHLEHSLCAVVEPACEHQHRWHTQCKHCNHIFTQLAHINILTYLSSLALSLTLCACASASEWNGMYRSHRPASDLWLECTFSFFSSKCSKFTLKQFGPLSLKPATQQCEHWNLEGRAGSSSKQAASRTPLRDHTYSSSRNLLRSSSFS